MFLNEQLFFTFLNGHKEILVQIHWNCHSNLHLSFFLKMLSFKQPFQFIQSIKLTLIFPIFKRIEMRLATIEKYYLH